MLVRAFDFTRKSYHKIAYSTPIGTLVLYLHHLVAPDRLQLKLSGSTTHPMPNASCTTKCYSLHWMELLHVSPYFDLDCLALLPISCYTASISQSMKLA
jgi:hypothetical protein